MGSYSVGDEETKTCSNEGGLLLSDIDKAAKGRAVGRYRQRIGRNVAVRGSSKLYKEIKASESHAFLWYWDNFWHGCGYLPQHVSEAINKMQAAIEPNRKILEEYFNDQVEFSGGSEV